MRSFFSLDGVFKTRNVVLVGLMVALKIILEPFSIYLTPTFKLITLSYLPGVMIAALLGPWAALSFGFVADTVGYMVAGMGPYFPGYAISEMLTYFIYACLLYKREVTIPRVLLARAIEMVTIIFGLNFLWNVIMYGSAASVYFTGARLINNLVQLPLHVAMSYICVRFARRLDSGVTRSHI